ncbi:unnamed protein product [Amoebophrya sp. A120]|nr:unnamed protein product [Amoebophrya sp. A120]|eukprot:GSA120T00021528001.1
MIPQPPRSLSVMTFDRSRSREPPPVAKSDPEDDKLYQVWCALVGQEQDSKYDPTGSNKVATLRFLDFNRFEQVLADKYDAGTSRHKGSSSTATGSKETAAAGSSPLPPREELQGDQGAEKEVHDEGATNKQDSVPPQSSRSKAAAPLGLYPEERRRIWQAVAGTARNKVSYAQFKQSFHRVQFLRNLLNNLARQKLLTRFVIPEGYDFSKPTAENYSLLLRGDDAKGVTTSSPAPPAQFVGLSKEEKLRLLNAQIMSSPLFGCIRADMDYEYHSYYTKTRIEWQDTLIKHVILKTERVHRPWLIYSCGPMGAGKGHVMRWLSVHNYLPMEQAVRIDPDLFKLVMPEFDQYLSKGYQEAAGTLCHRESGAIQEICLEAALRMSQNIWVDGSLRNTDWYVKQVADIRDRFPQYRIAIFYVHCSVETVRKRVIARSEATGRWIPDADLDESISGSKRSVERLSPMVDVVAQIRNETTPELEALLRVDRSQDFVRLGSVFSQDLGKIRERQSYPVSMKALRCVRVVPAPQVFLLPPTAASWVDLLEDGGPSGTSGVLFISPRGGTTTAGEQDRDGSEVNVVPAVSARSAIRKKVLDAQRQFARTIRRLDRSENLVAYLNGRLVYVSPVTVEADGALTAFVCAAYEEDSTMGTAATTSRASPFARTEVEKIVPPAMNVAALRCGEQESKSHVASGPPGHLEQKTNVSVAAAARHDPEDVEIGKNAAGDDHTDEMFLSKNNEDSGAPAATAPQKEQTHADTNAQEYMKAALTCRTSRLEAWWAEISDIAFPPPKEEDADDARTSSKMQRSSSSPVFVRGTNSSTRTEESPEPGRVAERGTAGATWDVLGRGTGTPLSSEQVILQPTRSRPSDSGAGDLRSEMLQPRGLQVQQVGDTKINSGALDETPRNQKSASSGSSGAIREESDSEQVGELDGVLRGKKTTAVQDENARPLSPTGVGKHALRSLSSWRHTGFDLAARRMHLRSSSRRNPLFLSNLTRTRTFSSSGVPRSGAPRPPTSGASDQQILSSQGSSPGHKINRRSSSEQPPPYGTTSKNFGPYNLSSDQPLEGRPAATRSTGAFLPAQQDENKDRPTTTLQQQRQQEQEQREMLLFSETTSSSTSGSAPATASPPRLNLKRTVIAMPPALDDGCATGSLDSEATSGRSEDAIGTFSSSLLFPTKAASSLAQECPEDVETSAGNATQEPEMKKTTTSLTTVQQPVYNAFSNAANSNTKSWFRTAPSAEIFGFLRYDGAGLAGLSSRSASSDFLFKTDTTSTTREDLLLNLEHEEQGESDTSDDHSEAEVDHDATTYETEAQTTATGEATTSQDQDKDSPAVDANTRKKTGATSNNYGNKNVLKNYTPDKTLKTIHAAARVETRKNATAFSKRKWFPEFYAYEAVASEPLSRATSRGGVSLLLASEPGGGPASPAGGGAFYDGPDEVSTMTRRNWSTRTTDAYNNVVAGDHVDGQLLYQHDDENDGDRTDTATRESSILINKGVNCALPYRPPKRKGGTHDGTSRQNVHGGDAIAEETGEQTTASRVSRSRGISTGGGAGGDHSRGAVVGESSTTAGNYAMNTAASTFHLPTIKFGNWEVLRPHSVRAHRLLVDAIASHGRFLCSPGDGNSTTTTGVFDTSTSAATAGRGPAVLQQNLAVGREQGCERDGDEQDFPPHSSTSRVSTSSDGSSGGVLKSGRFHVQQQPNRGNVSTLPNRTTTPAQNAGVSTANASACSPRRPEGSSPRKVVPLSEIFHSTADGDPHEDLHQRDNFSCAWVLPGEHFGIDNDGQATGMLGGFLFRTVRWPEDGMKHDMLGGGARYQHGAAGSGGPMTDYYFLPVTEHFLEMPFF